MKTLIAAGLLASVMLSSLAVAGEKAFPATAIWVAKVREAAPAKTLVQPKKPRKILVLSLATGYSHWVIPHVDKALAVLGEKSGAFSVDVTTDVADMTAANLAKYDAVVLNNTCSQGKFRNIFRDAMVEQWDKRGQPFPELTPEQRQEKAEKMLDDLIAYVAGGKGLISIHGGGTTFIKTPEFCAMLGGGFDYHLRQQMITYLPVNPAHPLLTGVPAEGLTMVDEPYVYNRGYADKDFRPLLVGDATTLKDKSERYRADVRYVAWIRAHDKGRVFSVSPSHNGSAYTNPGLLQFYLNGIQYALGDLECDDSPIGPKP